MFKTRKGIIQRLFSLAGNEEVRMGNPAQRGFFLAHCCSSNQMSSKFSLPDRYKGSENNVWVEFAQMSLKYKPLNLDLGFPDFLPPEHVTNAMLNIANSNEVFVNQYTRGYGHPRLISALAELYSRVLKRQINPLSEILIGVGAQQNLFSAIMGLVKDGDEVIMIEPFFDPYVPLVRAAGGKPVFIPLRKSNDSEKLLACDWKLDEKELASKFNDKTKMIILNTPLNPLGKVFLLEELELIADLCKKWNVLCLSDEVYEWLVYKPNQHIRIASLPGMWERTVTVGSAGKTFNVTGWKIGWAYGPENLIHNMQIVHQSCVYTCPTPQQEALGIAFELENKRFGTQECFFEKLPVILEPKRLKLTKILEEVGMKPITPQGGYFIVCDWSPIEKDLSLADETDQYKDYRFAKWMTKNVGIQGIPPSAFYSKENKRLAENLIRLCFIKKDENLEKAGVLLRSWKNRQ